MARPPWHMQVSWGMLLWCFKPDCKRSWSQYVSWQGTRSRKQVTNVYKFVAHRVSRPTRLMPVWHYHPLTRCDKHLVCAVESFVDYVIASAYNTHAANLITMLEAARISGYHPVHIRRLLRERKVAGRREGNTWLIDGVSLLHYTRGGGMDKRRVAGRKRKRCE